MTEQDVWEPSAPSRPDEKDTPSKPPVADLAADLIPIEERGRAEGE